MTIVSPDMFSTPNAQIAQDYNPDILYAGMQPGDCGGDLEVLGRGYYGSMQDEPIEDEGYPLARSTDFVDGYLGRSTVGNPYVVLNETT